MRKFAACSVQPMDACVRFSRCLKGKTMHVCVAGIDERNLNLGFMSLIQLFSWYPNTTCYNMDENSHLQCSTSFHLKCNINVCIRLAELIISPALQDLMPSTVKHYNQCK